MENYGANQVCCETPKGMLEQQKTTVGENIDNKIAYLKAEIARLEESKVTLGPLLGMRIRDIREAMNY